MDLFEYEGKVLLEKYGINIPNGCLSTENIGNINYPVMLKAQVLSGGRGKAGGIKKVLNFQQMKPKLREISQMTIKKEKVKEVYLEEMIEFSREIYISLLLDRDSKSPIIIACNQGGIDIESVPQENIFVQKINPLLGLQEYMIRKLSYFLKVNYNELSDLVYKIWNMFNSENAKLVEINPLFLKKEGSLVAGDAKISLEENKESRKNLLIARDSSSFDSHCKNLQASGVEMGGDIAIIASGAGLGMATMDIIKHKGGSVNSLVDLQGHVIHDLKDAIALIREIKRLKPKAYLFNFYFQLASCNVLAEAITVELSEVSSPIVVRMKGLDFEEAQNKLQQYSNIKVEVNLIKACDEIMSVREEV